MPFGQVTVQRLEGKILIIIDPPERGELSERGRAENLAAPSEWIQFEDGEDRLAIKLTVCRPIVPRLRRVR